ncbi:MAG: nucleotide sugar dehydrogenase [Candidatus Nitrosotenuis sp.]
MIISVYGLGNVGGPIAAAWLRAGSKVIGVDISEKLLSAIKSGASHAKEPFVSQVFTKALKENNFQITSDGISASKNSRIKIIAVPVALNKNKIELSALKSVIKDIGLGLKKGDAVIVCPSIPPGTSERVAIPMLEKFSKLKVERDFYFVYNPERIFEGRALQDIEENYPAIVSGAGKKSLRFAEELLKIIAKRGVLSMSTLANAEAEKLFEGVYRDVNIALANELANYCEKVGVNYWEARKGANSQPFCHLHYPGTGVGGLCIPVYPRFVIEAADKMGLNLKMLKFARAINDFMPKKCVNDALTLLSKNTRIIPGIKITILGLGFRGEVTDSRLSPTYTVVDEFLKKKFKVVVHDPFIKSDDNLPKNVELTDDLQKATKDASLIFVSTDHNIYKTLTDKSLTNAKKPLTIFDGRNVLQQDNLKDVSILTIGTR